MISHSALRTPKSALDVPANAARADAIRGEGGDSNSPASARPDAGLSSQPIALAPETTANKPADTNQPDRIIAPALPDLEHRVLLNLIGDNLNGALRMASLGNWQMAIEHAESATTHMRRIARARQPAKTIEI